MWVVLFFYFDIVIYGFYNAMKIYGCVFNALIDSKYNILFR
ncbi:protein of unknown function [Xenorhabdus poinarii G6]|uniref:Uncharacterized protein n=1 Tax=Xenorhabdus poinarii G6 TaxID=1354304 RepID=A0A068R4T3_9GAMM|nr:protein of unknown function [Xenorhabdus poinarii G6]